jgi:phage terminase large subunit-like protein
LVTVNPEQGSQIDPGDVPQPLVNPNRLLDVTPEGKVIRFKLKDSSLNPLVFKKTGLVDYKNMSEETKLILWAASVNDLASFVITFWPVIKGSTPLYWNHVMDIICYAYGQLREGNVVNNDVVLNVPPRNTKSIITNIMLVAYVWLKYPHLDFLCCCSVPSIGLRDATACRDILQSESYKNLFKEIATPLFGHEEKDGFILKEGSNQKVSYTNNYSGTRLVRAVEQTMIGNNADWILMDDLVDPSVILGTTEQMTANLEYVKSVYEGTIRKRRNNPRTAVQICIAQKLGIGDPPYFLVNDYGFNQIVLPQEYMPEHPRLSELDWRTIEGELLDENRFPREEVEISKKNVQVYKTQELQLDSITTGEMFPLTDWVEYDEHPTDFIRGPQAKDTSFVFAVYDTANTTTAKSKYTAAMVFALYMHRLVVIDIFRAKIDLNGLIELDDEINRRYPELNKIVVENVNSGESLCTLRANDSFYHRVNPHGMSKVERAQFTKRRHMRNLIWVPKRHLLTNQLKTEHSSFPSMSSINDMVDVMSHACKYLELEKRIELVTNSHMPTVKTTYLEQMIAQAGGTFKRDSAVDRVMALRKSMRNNNSIL